MTMVAKLSLAFRAVSGRMAANDAPQPELTAASVHFLAEATRLNCCRCPPANDTFLASADILLVLCLACHEVHESSDALRDEAVVGIHCMQGYFPCLPIRKNLNEFP